jgi:hypothetical protein
MEKIQERDSLIQQIDDTMSADHSSAFGAPGEPGNMEDIVSLSKRIAAFHMRALEWKREVRTARVDPRFDEYLHELALFADPVIEGIEEYGPYVLRQVREIIDSPPTSRTTLELSLQIGGPQNLDEFEEATNRLVTSLEAESQDVTSGYIYVLLNPSMDRNVLKIGKTKRTPEVRAAELSNATGVPLRFMVAYEAQVSNCDVAENMIHQRLGAYRISENREFFELPLKDAISVVDEIIKEIDN